jgi:hypothetical protein
MSADARGLLCKCSVCQREERTGDRPLATGWPKCCGYTMTLVETQRFIDTLEQQMRPVVSPLRALRGGA